MSDDAALATVRLVGVPLDVWARASEHHRDLTREFQLLAARPEGGSHTVPKRLLDLVDELTGRFAGFSAGQEEQRDAALDRGETRLDLTYELPVGAAVAARQLAEMLDEADEFCRQGDLLTLATPPDGLRFRRWYLAEFERQVAGEPPVAWDDYTG